MPYNGIKARAARDRFVRAMMKKGSPDLDVPLRDESFVSSPYGMREHPILKKPMLHEGIDYAAAPGTPIYASEDGWVDGNTPDPVGGYKVTVKHPDGYQSRYLHMSKVSKKGLSGGEVKRGDILGYVGTTGRSTGPHLHFGMRKDNRSVDPKQFFYKDYSGV